jgi:histidine kinase
LFHIFDYDEDGFTEGVTIMSIRKRLIISHAAMIITPILVLVVIMGLLHIVFIGTSSSVFGTWGDTDMDTQMKRFTQLKKTVSLHQEKLFEESYLNRINEQLEKEETYLVIRKGNQLIYSSKEVETMTLDKLPSFGSEESRPVVIRNGEDHFSVLQYDFYFQDGNEGSIFLLNHAPSFVTYARVFFPILILSLILILFITNAALSYFMSKKILRPVNQLSWASDKISRGDFDFTIKPKGNDELNRLLRTFDHMRLQLKESIELRDQYERNRRELVANISHDLKTPITSIMGYVEGIQDGVANTPEKQKQYLDTIHLKTNYINQLIEELALFSKLDVNRETFHFEKVNIAAFIEDYQREIEDDMAEKGINLNLNGNTTSDVLIDRNKMIRVIQNIIYNSVKYIEKKPGEISVSLTDKEKMVEVCISDNGTGVPDEDLKNIFTRFYRVDASRSSDGSGLGLAIASQIIHAHKGNIWAENRNSGGLRVCFTLQKVEDEERE